VLRGHATERVQRLAHDALSTWGIGTDLSEPEWRSVFRQLVALGFLETDSAAYGALKLTAAARGVLRGETRVPLRAVAKRPRVRARGGSPARVTEETPLLTAWREWRLASARDHGVPAYVVFHDATLEAIAAARPRTLEDLRGIAGIGAAKLA